MRKPLIFPLLLVLACLCVSAASGLDIDRLRVQRKEVFEFTERPTVTRDGDSFSIRFAVKDYCDVTVAIEQPGTGVCPARILRHLASGVLGTNAPAPFARSSLKQCIVWDGKDELGEYVKNSESCVVRVSLGLRARMERTLYWSGQQKFSAGYAEMQAAPEGVYVFLTGHGDQVRLYDHDGNYVRTVYPFPRGRVDKVQGLKWREYPPDNQRLPDKQLNHDQDTLLPTDGLRTLAVRGDRLILVGDKALLLSADGSSGGADMVGPDISFPGRGGDVGIEPRHRAGSAAISPDGKRLYLTCYSQSGSYQGHGFMSFLHGVNVVELDGKLESRTFAGVLERGQNALGSTPDKLWAPLSVACDSQGRVYVADNLNNRIQVFSPDGKLVKSVPTQRPGIVRVHPRTGQIHVVTSDVQCHIESRAMGLEGKNFKSPPLVLRVLGPLDDPKEQAVYKLDVPTSDYYRLRSVYDVIVEIDFATEPMTVWTSLAPSSKRDVIRTAIQLWRPKGDKLVMVRDFAKDAAGMLADPRPARFGRPRVWTNPATGMVYLGLITQPTAVACKSFHQVVRIDPASGVNRLEQMPTDAEDIGFDWKGHIYLRAFDAISRFDPVVWREVPFDYGDNRIVYHGQGGGGERPFTAASAVRLPSCIGGMFHMGGMGVAPDGTTVVSCINPADPEARKAMAEKKVFGAVAGKPYTPQVYPGRNMGWETHVFDKHGKILHTDVAPGIGVSNYLQIDRAGNVYLLAASTPYLGDKPYSNGRGCTLIKIVPGKMKCLTRGGPVPLGKNELPNRTADMTRPDPTWVEGAEWLFGPVGADGHYGSGGKCSCYVNGRFALDYYGRSFAPEIDRFRVVVLDTNGNVMMRIGQYGNVDDGVPLIAPDPALVCKPGGQPPQPQSIGGDEVAIMHCQNLTVHSDRRLFLADIGNQCIRSVKLDYHAEERVELK